MGCQAGYPFPWRISASTSVPTEYTISQISSRREVTELRWLVNTLILSSWVFKTARLVDVSTRPGTARLMAITPWGIAYSISSNLSRKPVVNAADGAVNPSELTSMRTSFSTNLYSSL